MLELKNIVKDYVSGDTTVHALKGVNLTFRKNEFVSVLGPSGCGKTTMLNIIGGLDKYTSGDLVINGVSTKQYKDGDWDNYRNHSIGFVFQSYNLIPHQTVLGNVELALTLSGVPKKEKRERAVRALERVGLKDQLHKLPNQLSGGQMRRVALAGVIAMNPGVLVLDEPTAGLDPSGKRDILRLINSLRQTVKIVIIISHNMDEVAENCNRVVVLSEGKNKGVFTTKQLFSGDQAAKMGVELPSVTKLARLLASKGMNIDRDIYKESDLIQAIAKAKGVQSCER